MKLKTNSFSQASKRIIAYSALGMATVIALEAIGAHMLQEILDQPEFARLYNPAISQFKTACIACIGFAMASYVFGFSVKIPTLLSLIGMVLFSGSLFTILILKLQGIKLSKLSMLAPIGGFAYIASWIVFAYLLFSNLKNKATHE